MKDFEIGIIGGTRGMGKWFADLLTGQGYMLHVSGRTSGPNYRQVAEKCDVVVVSVPIGVTGKVIKQVGPLMRKDTLFMDLTSLKEEPVKLMAEYSVSEVIGCHPLFGPQIKEITGQHVVLCLERSQKWFPWLKTVFRKAGAITVETTPEKHDKMMAIVQGLNHLNTMTMGLVIGNMLSSSSELDQFTTPVFRTKMEIIRKVFCDNPGLYTEIITHNPQIDPILDEYKKVLSELETVIRKRDTQALKALMEKHASNIYQKGNP